MSTLFLASAGLSALPECLPADPSDLRLLFVPTAADLDFEPAWVDRDRKALTRMGFDLNEVDIKGASYEQASTVVGLIDVIFIAGGNTFHLLHSLNESGFGRAIKDRPELIYVGASAGAVVAGPDIAAITTLDRPEIAEPMDSTVGLNLVPFVVLPHYNRSTNGAHYDDIIENHGSQFEYVPLTDKQAIVVQDGKREVVVSR